MSKKHFVAAARLVASLPINEREIVYNAFASLFIQFNPRFDWQRFKAACGL